MVYSDEQAVCTVCHLSLPYEHAVFGERAYCQEHLEQITLGRPSLWRSTLTSVGLILLMTFVAALASGLLNFDPKGLTRLAINLLFALLPPLIWFVTLYRQDDSLPAYIPAVFFLAALVQAAITRPFLQALIGLNAWLDVTNPTNRLLSNILLGGSTHAFLLYAMIRYMIWLTPTFQRRMDGLLYGMIVGWGYGATANVLLIADYGGVTLLNGGIRILAQTLTYLTGGIIVGYYLGRNRFENLRIYYLSVGVGMAALVIGTLFYAANELNSTQLNLTQDAFSPWPGGFLSLGALVLTFSLSYELLRRHNELARGRLEVGE